ncbi:bifunctional biotin--[acetyl-CoA-carboxylase] ligase/biotin operon repressor BirA [Pseudoxanthomonas helianthi]|uniref:Bifunctional ligase/repressor BirA n=1 Tax=Pseudoxanthomonas helianthi TaxID=1453541 RepID=A0A940WYQ9_9GAMM|nr:bifunctional biotin--[acetyl-CoA-carboxylase] ligase/biotin operon repressor BirA [Pseudoxanthomonas helianthi]MBP3983210.1 bifunctional biotin--[acetyl-CoA-carboxylase] ligase/biotin operon repressor BirA [Pseudoxanthomonas helianthi]
MSVDRDLLLRLAAGPVSGAELARETGLTRAAMWKRIEALREAGVDIEARPGQGYALARAPDWLDAQAIRAALPAPLRAGLAGLEVAWSLDSTNSELLRRSTPVRGVEVLLAERQTGGRGRRGRAWASPLAAHIYLSLARQFGGGLARLGGLSLVAGIAAAEALREAGFDGARLKWPNDLVVVSPNGFRKLGGLLVEGGGEHGGPVRAVVGLGINVRMPETHAAGIDQPWIDLQSLSAEAVSRNRIVAALLGALLPAFDRFDAEGLAPFLPRYAALDALAGREVDVHEGLRTRRGIASGLAEDGALRMQIEGSEQRLYAGDVSVRAK